MAYPIQKRQMPPACPCIQSRNMSSKHGRGFACFWRKVRSERPMDQKTRQLEILHAQQASSWVETMRHPNQGDEQRFVAWLKESPHNVREFLLMLSVDHALGELDARRLHDIQSLIATANRRVAARPIRAAANIAASRTRRWLPATLAAGVLLAV